MIHFFRDVMDGPIYIVVLILSILAIMGIIGFIMERYKLRNEENSKIQVVDAPKPEKAGTLIISTKEKKKEEKPDLEKTELLEVITKEQLQKQAELEKTEVLSIVSEPKTVSKEEKKAPAVEITPPKMSESALEKTEVLEIVSLPPKKTEEELGKTEILDLNFNLPKEEVSTPIPAVEVTTSPTKTEMLAINSNPEVSGDMNVKQVEGEETKKPTTVIDFGSTSDVKINQS